MNPGYDVLAREEPGSTVPSYVVPEPGTRKSGARYLGNKEPWCLLPHGIYRETEKLSSDCGESRRHCKHMDDDGMYDLLF